MSDEREDEQQDTGCLGMVLAMAFALAAVAAVLIFVGSYFIYPGVQSARAPGRAATQKANAAKAASGKPPAAPAAPASAPSR